VLGTREQSPSPPPPSPAKHTQLSYVGFGHSHGGAGLGPVGLLWRTRLGTPHGGPGRWKSGSARTARAGNQRTTVPVPPVQGTREPADLLWWTRPGTPYDGPGLGVRECWAGPSQPSMTDLSSVTNVVNLYIWLVGARDLRTLWSPPVSLNLVHVLVFKKNF
jgi:hypothetical protein